MDRRWTARDASLFGREHLLFLLATALILVHLLYDYLVDDEELAPPTIPLVLVALLYPVLPAVVRAAAAFLFGAVLLIAQSGGHVLPLARDERGVETADVLALAAVAGCLLLLWLGWRLVAARRTAPSV